MATATTTTPMTAEEFFDWANRPENIDKRWELEAGEVVEMPSPAELHGTICWLVGMVLGQYVFSRGAGYVCTNDTGLIVKRDPDTVRGPDVMLHLDVRTMAELSRTFSQRVPALVVEVFSPSDRPGKLMGRVAQYHRRGVPLVWVVFPEERTVNVYYPNEFPKVLDETDELTGNGVLPDFACPVRALFALPGPTPPAAPAA